MENVKTRLNYLAKKIKDKYDYYNLTRNEDFYKLVILHECEEVFLEEQDVVINWVYFKNVHKMYETGLHPTDVRNFGGDYDF